MELPGSTAEAGTRTRESARARSGIMTTVLIVDDSPIDRRLVAGILERNSDWTIRSAIDGLEAMASVVEHMPDLVVTDMQMPQMNGLELVTSLRQQFPQIPVVLMTAQGSEELAVQALRAGAASYVPKRTLALDLQPTVRRVLTAATDIRSQAALMNRLEQRRESYRIETELPLVMALSRQVQHELGELWSLEKTDRLRIGTALEEALLNAFYHGNLEISSSLKESDYAEFYALAERRCQESPYSNRRIQLDLEVTPVVATITILDEGRGFNPASLPDPTDVENLDRPSGRGVMLMRAFMDDIRYNTTGNQVTLIKRRYKQ